MANNKGSVFRKKHKMAVWPFCAVEKFVCLKK